MLVRLVTVGFWSCDTSVGGGWAAAAEGMALRALGLEDVRERGGSWTEYCNMVDLASYGRRKRRETLEEMQER